MPTTTFIPIGGFLGAGKTTFMLAVASYLQAQGASVCCITNDQGEELVDTRLSISAGLDTTQITRGCFCCKYDELSEVITHIITYVMPDYILAEAVGSCTDLNATVIKPLKREFGERIEVFPLSVLADPSRIIAFMKEEAIDRSELHYLFGKQIEEAAVILLNKTDLYLHEQISVAHKYIREMNESAAIIMSSARQRDGIEAWYNQLCESSERSIASLDINYDTYGRAEAMLGWLNAGYLLQGRMQSVVTAAQTLASALAQQFKHSGIDVAHVKLWFQETGNSLKMSAVDQHGFEIDHITNPNWSSDRVTLVINARLVADPTLIWEVCTKVMLEFASNFNLQATEENLQCFAPAMPVPTHRL